MPSETQATAKLTSSADGSEWTVDESLTLGRAPENDVVADDPAASRQHARIERLEDGAFLLMDLGSSNGTVLNGRPLRAPTRLQAGDVIGVGALAFTVEISRPTVRAPAPAASDETVKTDEISGRSMIGQSPAMVEVFNLIGVAAESSLPVLVVGETGTGKELVARAVHDASDRSERPFLALNCATLVEGLLESELFGHRKGAFTGADRDHVGLFEAAEGGTVFLDEVGEMPLATQPKLLRVLEEGEVVRVGETKPRSTDVRIVSATNRDLEKAVEAGDFRRDLFFRLATFPVPLPPLRDREGDVPLLARHAASLAAQKQDKRVAGFTDAATAVLERYDWPGNARELRNEMQRAVALVGDGEPIDERHLSPRVLEGPAPAVREVPAVGEREGDATLPDEPPVEEEKPGSDLREARAEFEAAHILRVLEENNGHIGKTAEALGLSRTALYKKFKEYGIER